MENEFEIQVRLPVPRYEQETIITYDKQFDEWSLYTNNPTHARKWERAVITGRSFSNRKVYHEQTGQLIELEGVIDGSVSIRKAKVLTEEQRKELSERLQQSKSR